jgi:16S rRNA (guanine527-N7)-methyltransferase
MSVGAKQQTGSHDVRRGADTEPLAQGLAEGLAGLGLVIAPQAQAKLLQYCALLIKWNRVYNLSAIREPGRILTHHLLDSLAVLKRIQEDPALGDTRCRVLDVGSGAGLPGIPLALACDSLELELVEPVGKKAAFLRQSVIELGLSARVTVHAHPVEQIDRRQPDLIICRAFASLADYVRSIEGQLESKTRIWAMKGKYPSDEISALDAPWRVDWVYPLEVPGVDGERHLLELTRSPRLAPEG